MTSGLSWQLYLGHEEKELVIPAAHYLPQMRYRQPQAYPGCNQCAGTVTRCLEGR